MLVGRVATGSRPCQVHGQLTRTGLRHNPSPVLGRRYHLSLHRFGFCLLPMHVLDHFMRELHRVLDDDVIWYPDEGGSKPGFHWWDMVDIIVP